MAIHKNPHALPAAQALPFALSLIAAALALPAQAQTAASPTQTSSNALPAVTVSGSSSAPVTVGGFGDLPVAKLPLQAQVISNDLLNDLGIEATSGLTRLDASVGDAYNSLGYVSYLKVRGYDLDNRFNYRRDGLPINAETALLMANKGSLELLKGTSGIQAGTSAPGGLVNYVVKRPTGDLTTLSLGASERGTVQAALDWSRRLGDAKQFGLRVNAMAAHLDPELRDAKGQRRLLAVAGDWRASPELLVEAELELSHQHQPSQPGFSLLGNRLPDARAIDPRTNLNNQDWSQPVAFDGQTASLRVTRQLGADWSARAHLMTQRLVTDDRLAYPFGCTESADIYWPSSYCPNGNFDLADFRSENERRHSDAAELSVQGRFATAGLQHQLGAGLLLTRFKSRFQGQAYNAVGTGNISGLPRLPADPTLNDANTNRDERSTELFLRDAIQIGTQWQAWLGLRHTRLQRESVRVNTSDLRATDYRQSFTTPWLGLSYAINPQLMAYVSWGEGIQSEVAPNRPRYSNAGQPLPALRSRQWEVGLKSGSKTVDWSVNWFDISQPAWRDVGPCNSTPGSCERRIDGTQDHQGLEAQADFKWSGGGLLASAMQLKARRNGSADPALNGLRPANVPQSAVKLQARQSLPQLPGLQLMAGLAYEGRRAVLPDNSLFIPSWTRLDLGARYELQLGRQLAVLRVGVDNATNRRAWKESPYQYEHVYLYPMAPRTWRASLEWVL